MFGRNKNEDDFISLDKEDYPEIYPEQREIYPEERYPQNDSRFYAPAAVEPGIFAEYLYGGEQVLWLGKGKLTKKKEVPLFFAVFWTGFSVLWTVLASIDGGWAGLFGLPFVAVGIWLFVCHFKGGGDIHYAVTDKRVLILNGKELKMEYLDKITDVRVYQVSKNIAGVKYYFDAYAPNGSINENILLGLNADEAQRVCSLILSESARERSYRN